MNLKEIDMTEPFDDVLQLNVLTRGALRRSGFRSIGYLANRTIREFGGVKGLGKKGVAEIVQKLAEVGLMLPTGRSREEEGRNMRTMEEAHKLMRARLWFSSVFKQCLTEQREFDISTVMMSGRSVIGHVGAAAKLAAEQMVLIIDGKVSNNDAAVDYED